MGDFITCNRLPFSMPGVTQFLPFGSVHMIGSPPLVAEAGAAAHWVFGVDNPNLLDLVSNQPLRRTFRIVVTNGGTGYASGTTNVVLGGDGWAGAAATATIAGGVITGISVTAPPTAQPTDNPTVTITGAGTGATATATPGPAPTITDGYAGQPGDCGLLTPIADSVTQTIIGIMKPLNANGIPWGTFTGSTTSGGSGLIYNSGAGLQLTRPSGSTLTVLAEGATGAVERWIGVADVRTAADRLGRVSGRAAVSDTNGKTVSVPQRKVALGNAYQSANSSYQAPIVLAELIVFNDDRRAAIPDILNRSRQRLAPRGIGFLPS